MNGGRSTPAAFPVNPPWPPASDMARGVEAPVMGNREAFAREAVDRYGDEDFHARERWIAARRLLADGDLCGPIAPADSGTAEESRKFSIARALAAWLLTPREEFIPAVNRNMAYLPYALPLGHDQTISAPYMVSRMTSALNPGPEDAVLEIGTGSGYQAAMLAALSSNVRTVEYVGPLSSAAGETLAALAGRRPWLDAIRRRSGNGYEGWDEGAPYSRIVVTCAIDHVPPALMDQTSPGGIILLPLGESRVQRLLAFRRRTDGEVGPPGGAWRPAGELITIPETSGEWDWIDVYGNGTRVVFVPFVY